ncbi:unnamed protein product [Symbiodinium sp. CCMP2592]|nr:unnamed protein product [Symbiodinium sp. CCMP2592]
MLQAFWGEEAPTESNNSMDLAVTEGFIKAASQAVKEELLQEWRSFRADLLREFTHLIHAEVAKVPLGSPAEHEDVPGTPPRRSKSQEVATPEKLAKPVASLAARVNGENVDTNNPVLGMDEDFPCAPRRRHKAQDDAETPEKLVKPSSCGSAEAAFVKDKEENRDASNFVCWKGSSDAGARPRFTATAWTWMTRSPWMYTIPARGSKARLSKMSTTRAAGPSRRERRSQLRSMP